MSKGQLSTVPSRHGHPLAASPNRKRSEAAVPLCSASSSPKISHFCVMSPHVYRLPDLYQTLRDKRFQVPRLATCIRPHRTKLLSHPATNNIESTRRGLPQRDTTTSRRTMQYHHIASKCTSKEAAQNEQIIEGQRNPSHENYALVCLFPIKPQVFHPKNPCCKFQVYPILGILASLGTGLHELWGHSVSFQAFASGAHFFATLQSTPSRAATPCSVHTQPIKKRSRLRMMHNCQLPWLVAFFDM